MTPAERVAFILHDVFGHPFTEIARIVGRTPAACRQLASSGRRRIRAAHPSAAHTPALTIIERTVNGQPGLIAQQEGITVTVFAFGITGDHVTRIWAIRNPDKLRPWATG